MKYVIRLKVIVALVATGLLPLTGAGAGVRTVPAASSLLWTAGFQATGVNAPQAAAMSPDGSMVYVAGYGNSPERLLPSIVPRTGVTIAYDTATGVKVWQQQFSAVVKDGTAFVNAIAVSPDGSTVFVTGDDNPSTKTRRQRITIAYNAVTGAQIWQALYKPGVQSAQAIAVSPDGSTVFVTGTGDTTLAYDAATGAQLWAASYPKSEGTALAVSPGGATVYAAGSYSIDKTKLNYGIVAFNAATGATEWARHSGEQGTAAEATSVAVNPDGSAVYLTGKTASGQGLRTVAYNAATGATLWTVNTKVAGTSIVAAPDGATVYTTGYTSANGGTQVTTAYDAATGAQTWVRRYDPAGSRYSTPVAAAITAEGSTLFVGGYSSPSVDRDVYTSVAYNAVTGAPLWFGRFARLGSAVTAAMAIAPDGSEVVLTGAYGFDYKTVAFRLPAGLSGEDVP